MIFHPVAAYGIAFAVVALLTFFGFQNRRAGYRRERHDLISENLALWQSVQQEETLASTQSAPQPLNQPAPTPTLQDQLAYHANQLTQLQIALSSAGSPSVRPDPALDSKTTEKKDKVRVS